jgi:Zn-dependent protease with chaperone function
MARDLAIMIEENRDAAVTTEWDDLLAAVRKAFNADHPDAAERIAQLQNQQE